MAARTHTHILRTGRPSKQETGCEKTLEEKEEEEERWRRRRRRSRNDVAMTTTPSRPAAPVVALSTSSSSHPKKKKRPPPQEKTWVQEFLLGGVSTSVACLLSNPFDVLKTRMQLQGELQSKGTYTIHYRNVLHAAWTIVRVEGVLALQKGLGPALVYQFVMNGLRLGTFQTLVNMGFTRGRSSSSSSSSSSHDRRPSSTSATISSFPTPTTTSSTPSSSADFARSALAGAAAGCLGGVVASPLYLVKIQLQSAAIQAIAVGHQHRYTSMYQALKDIHRQHGVKGLWRGVEGAVPRLMLGSALQLSTYSYIKQKVRDSGRVGEAWVPVAASLLSSINIIIFMEPFDVVRTRLYNQPTDAQGKGVYYRGFTDCFRKVVQAEGFFHGMYKGAGAAYFRMAPQAILGLSFWDSFRRVWYGREAEGSGKEEEDDVR